MPVVMTRVGRAAVLALGGLFLLPGSALAPVVAATAAAAPQVRSLLTPCAAGSAAVVSAVSLSQASSAQTRGPQPPGTPTPSPTTTTPTPSQSASSPPPSGSPSQSPSPSATPGVICVTAQIVQQQSTIWPGGQISYSIWVWSTQPASAVTATATSHGLASGPPTFTLCPAAQNNTCTIGNLATDQAIELLVANPIGTTATVGEQVTLNLTVQGSGVSPAAAALTASVGTASPTPSVTPSTSPPPPITAPQFPAAPGSTVTPNNLNSIFPVVTPTPALSITPPKKGRVTAATPTSSTLPLDPRLIGGQLAGLAILAAAVTLVVARLSLRPATPTAPAAPTEPSAPGAPASPPVPSPPSGDADQGSDPPADDKS